MIHSSAIVDTAAEIADDVEIGPYAVIGARVTIESGTRVGAHTVIQGPAKIGRDNVIHPFNSLGGAPQDKKYDGESTELIIGERNTIREYCTFNRGTAQDKGLTKLGDDNWIMAYTHIAPDCHVGNETIFANCAALAGHVTVEDKTILGGYTIVHQFCRIGYHAFTGMGTIIRNDVPPYTMLNGNPAHPYGINTEGLRRSGYTAAQIRVLRQAYKIIYKSGNHLQEAIEQLEALAEDNSEVGRLPRFLRASGRGIVR